MMKWVIVTGDTGKLGQALVSILMSNTEHGVIGISRSESGLAGYLHEARYVHLRYDLQDVENVPNLYAEQISKIGPVYGLVNNSAQAYDDIVTNANVEQLTRMYNVNVLSPIMLTKFAIRNMLLHNTAGSIIQISSVSAHTGYKGLSMYGSTKGAMEAFSRGIAREWGSRGIRSNIVIPGFMETAMSASLSEEKRNKIYSRNSLRGPTNPISVANTVEFLLSDRSKSITGSSIRVDNGSL